MKPYIFVVFQGGPDPLPPPPPPRSRAYQLTHFSRYTYKDTEWRQILKVDDESLVLASGYGFIEDLIPGISYVWESPKMTRLKAIMKEINDTLLVKKFLEHKNSFDRG